MVRHVSNFTLFLLALFFLLGVQVAADWLSPPAPKYQATELAGMAPEDSVTVLAWAFQGQLDIHGLAAKLTAVLPEEVRANQASFERELGYSPAQVLKFFTGNGYFAADETFLQGEEFRYGLGLELAKPQAFDEWLSKLLEDSKVQPYQHRGFQIRRSSADAPILAVGQDWFLMGKDRAEIDRHIDALEGRNRLSVQKRFAGAVQSLGVKQSSLCLYLDGEAVTEALEEETELSEGPGAEVLALWDYAILTVDFPSNKTDGLLGLKQVDNALSRALRQKGGIDTGTLSLVPENLSTLAAVDLAWGLEVLEAAAGESSAELIAMSPQALGDLREAFSGPTVFATDLLDRLGPMLASELVGDRDDVRQCQLNLKSLRVALSFHNGPPEDAWKVLAQELPTCPAAGAPTYRYRERDESPEIYCAGSHHLGLAADNPRTTSQYLSQADLSEELGGAGEPNRLAIARVRNPELAHNFLSSLDQKARKPSSKLLNCKLNLKRLGTALEMYSTDWSGQYPTTMATLTPNYLKTIPKCPASGKDTYSASLKVGPDAPGNDPAYEDYYYLECQGKNHRETEANYPRYNAIVGLDTGPEVEMPKLVAIESPSDPKGITVYDGDDVVLLDPARMVAIMASGPSARVLAKKKRTEPLPQEVAEALRWGDEGLVYLGHSSLKGLFDYAQRVLTEVLPPEGGARVLLDMALVMRETGGELQDVQAIKSVPEGLRYRSRGYTATPVFGSTLMVGAAIIVPNFIRARATGQLTACKSNLKNIGTALEMYSTDWDGKYPDSFEKVTPDYIRRIPECPAAGQDTYSESYSQTKGDPDGQNWDSYEVYCRGHFHEAVGVPENYPQYNGMEGLIDR